MNTTAYITSVVTIAVVSVFMMGIMVKILGARIDDLSARLSGLEIHMTALESTVRQVSGRLTVLETKPGRP